MAKVDPIMVSDATAAKMLDLPLSTFQRLVGEGVLPRGREIAAGIIRHDVDNLRRAVKGHAIEGMEDVRW